MKRIFLFFVWLFLLTSCLQETTTLLSQDPLSKNGEVFVDESGEEFKMGCEGSRCYGFISGAADSDKTLHDLQIPVSLPDRIDLSGYLPPVGDQGSIGSCTAWATTYYGGSLHANLQHSARIASTVQLSPSYIYNQLTQGNCRGTNPSNAMQMLVDQGASEWDIFPYQDNGCNLQPDANQRANAEKYRMKDFKILSGHNLLMEMKTLLSQRHPVVVAMGLDREFGKKDERGLTAYRPHKVRREDIQGAHAMLVVGYSDEYQAFKLVNSWGDGWGDEGFVWVDYAAFENVHDVNSPFRVLCQALVGFY